MNKQKDPAKTCRVFLLYNIVKRKEVEKMERTFMVNFSESEFRAMLKETVLEIMRDVRPTAPSLPEILDVKLAADFVRLKVSTLYEKTSRKLIPHFKKGNKLYFNRAELEEWVKAGKVKTSSDLESEAASYVLNEKRRKK